MVGPSCLILVSNEQYFLPYVLTQLEGHFDSFVIYDVGSTDNTREVIDWWVGRMQGKADLMVRYMPMVPKEVQGAFRNSQIVEGQRDTYMLVDGDELYTQKDLAKVAACARDLHTRHQADTTKRFGVFKRIEVSPDLTQRYVKERSHHRLYTADAFWTGTHPGEVSAYKQNEESEIWYGDIKVRHMHNTLRSPNEEVALNRLSRKNKKSYHPVESGTTSFDLLSELPMLQKPIENFPVSPALAALQAARS